MANIPSRSEGQFFRYRNIFLRFRKDQVYPRLLLNLRPNSMKPMMFTEKKALYTIGAALICWGLTSCGTSASSVKIATHTDSISYALGVDVGNSFNQIGLEISSEALYKGVADAIEDKVAISDEEKEALLRALNQDAQQAQMQKQEVQGKENEEKGKAFLAENQQKEGIQVTETGLQYEVIQAGTGDTPKATDEVTVHYTGKLLNGEVFDSSVERGTPATFQLNRVIPGWTEGLQLMNKGSKYTLYIPAELGYGPMGSPPKIGPNETLIFEVELLDIKVSEEEK